MAQRPRIVLLGRQGAGKGTQSARLAAELGIPHVSTGELFRAAVASGTAVGRQVASVLDSGQLVSDDLVVEVVRDRVVADDLDRSGYLFDGFPRTVAQAETFFSGSIDLDAPTGPGDVVAVDLEVPEEVVIDRITRRRVCPVDGWTTTVDDPSVASVPCPDGHDAVARADDGPDAVRRRLSLYATETEPVVDWFADHGSLVRVDGTGDPEAVYRRLVGGLESYLDVALDPG